MGEGGSTPVGLTTAEARLRLAESGANELLPASRVSRHLARIGAAFNPLTLILLVAAAVSGWLGEVVNAAVIATVVATSTAIQFAQTARADRAVRRLREGVGVTATVRRDGAWVEVLRREVVPGDIIRLSAGDLVPADARLVEARDLHVQQAALTGESLPAEKQAGAEEDTATPTPDRANRVFFGTSVVSGTGTAVVTATGRATAFGNVAARLASAPPETAFDRGVRHFGLFITQTVLVMVVFVFLVCSVRQRDPFESLLFALALAVGLTPELLPMIVAVTLARGAERMARRHVVVKHLAAIQNLGSIDVLCTDKTGTLTLGEMTLEGWSGPTGEPSDRVLLLAYLHSRHETGIRSPLDAAVLTRPAPPGVEAYRKRDEVPFDSDRRRASVVLDCPEGTRFVTKGSPEGVLAVCGAITGPEGERELTPEDRARVLAELARLGASGYRVLAVAAREVAPREQYTRADEVGLTFAGLLWFRDPIRPDAARAVHALGRDGVRVVMLTGDNESVARAVAGQVGLPAEAVLTGADVSRLSDPALGVAAERTPVFARMSPAQKTRVLAALKARGHAVGFLGDGVNDAPSLHAADVGVSVSGAVDVAKEAAAVILTRPGLAVLHAGVMEGRQAFGNVTKYLLMGTSSNFGNMLSMSLATVFLPFLPMLPAQVLLNNLLYDAAQLPIPTDRVDPGFARKPRRWDIGLIGRFMLVAGPISSAFDLLAFAGLIGLFHASERQFQTAWFVESLLTQTLVLLVIRTSGDPLRHPPSRLLAWTIAAVCVAAVALPYSPLAAPLGFEPLPVAYLGFIAALVAGYLAAVALVKGVALAPPG
jgi:Mg2+-importing ATPase